MNRYTHLLTACLFALPTNAFCQQTVPAVRDTVTVVGQLDPVTEGTSERSTTALDPQPQHLLLDTPADLLRSDASVDIEERGGGGVQDDVSIRGSSYEQTLVLLNGLRINDSETSHFNLDLPVPLDALGGLYVLHGAGSTLYGSDAVSGVVNITTARPIDRWAAKLRAGAGSFGGNTQAALLSASTNYASEVLAGGRDFSEGFIPDRDYRSEQLSSETRFTTALGESEVLLAVSDRAFGASEFYGDYPSYERTKGWFASITQPLGVKTQAALAYRRHTDVFVLFRDQPSIYENNHIDSSWQGVLRRSDNVAHSLLHLDTGLDINADEINSSSLGRHGRNRGAGYANAQLKLGPHGTASVGLREEIFGGGPVETVPSFSASYYIASSLKLRADISRGFRLPTYTDKYYSDPANVGNPNLKPESAWSYEAGADWYPTSRWAISATGFTSQQHDVIDYVRASPTDLWHAENLTQLSLTGAEVSAEFRPCAGQQVRLALTTVSGAKAALNGLEDKYAFNFPSQNAVAEYIAHVKQGLTLRESLRVVNRVNGQLYPVVDSSLAYEGWRIHPYLQMTNLNNASYQEVVGVPMPPRAFAGGLEITFSKGR